MDTCAVTAIVGRDEERAALRSFVTDDHGRSLVVRGESGIGKTTLVEQAAAIAEERGDTVIRVRGVEAESALPYAGLHQILYPLLGRSTDLDDGARAVFETVFGQRDQDKPSVMTLGIAVLDLFEAAAGDTALLLVLDDAQWLDAVSAQVCGFVGRRLRGGAVKMLAATRTETDSPWDGAALPELELAPLSQDAAAQLLDLRFPALPARTRRLTLDNAGGNPLALLELPTHIAADTEDTDELFDEPAVPVPHRLQRLYGARIAALGAPVREELLRGALDAPTQGSGPRYRMREVGAAVAQGLLVIDPTSGDHRFRHPLVRSAVIHTATLEQRRAAHAALAGSHADDLERRAGHLAAAAVGPDESVAAILEAAAAAATRRGGAGAAVAWLTRAARLSENPADRSRRLGDAAFVAGHAARLDRAQRIVRTDPETAGRESPSAVLAAVYASFYSDGDVRSSHRRVVAALEASRGVAGPSETSTRLVDLLLAISQYAGDARLWSRTRRLLDDMGDLVTASSRIYRDTWSDVVRHGAGAADRVMTAGARLAELTPWDATRLAVSAYHLDIAGEFRPHLRAIVDRELDTGAVASGIVMSHVVMLDQISTGEWDAAETTGLRALDRATELGFELFAQQSRGYLAHVAALRGQAERARSLLAEVESWSRPRGVGFLVQLADAVGALVAASEGDHESAYRRAVAIGVPGQFTPYAYQSSRTLFDLVEAAMYTGRIDEARAHVRAAHTADLAVISPRLAVLTDGAGALVATEDAQATALVTRAENHPAADRFPFELARIRLAHGIRLRHSNSRNAARPHLTAAAEAFDRLGARPWADRAHAELRALGVSARVPEPDTAALTWQEQRIAELAAAGLTNKEIGRQLYLSPRTVSSHLYRVFPKLGITTRAALRDALARRPEMSSV